MIDEAVRCGYSKCRAQLPPPGPQGGRRRSFCRDTRWPGGRTCGQMARAERDALDALGLDSGPATFRLDADRLREHVDAVRVPVTELATALDAVAARLDEVEGSALAAVEAAQRGTAEAEAARVEAQQARERAERESREARERAEQAAEERA
ncbi:response regulator receiver protein, partial [Pseudonocardia aurantiaca]